MNSPTINKPLKLSGNMITIPMGRDKCLGCGRPIQGYNGSGYCDNCACPDCGYPMKTAEERKRNLCEECQSEI